MVLPGKCHLHPDSKVRTSFVQLNKHWKVLLKSFHLNGHTVRFHPRTQKLEKPSAWLTVPQENTAHWLSFEWTRNRISPKESKTGAAFCTTLNSITVLALLSSFHLFQAFRQLNVAHKKKRNGREWRRFFCPISLASHITCIFRGERVGLW